MLAEVNGIQLAYSDTGAGSPVVLLVHGFPLNRSMWDPQVGSLRAAGARVIAPDLRGFGASEGGPAGPLMMEQHADDLAALLDVLNVREPVVLCGLSMGGYVGFAFWRRHSDLVRALVLIDTRASADTEDGRQARLAMAERVEAANSVEPALENMPQRYFSPTLRSGSPVIRAVEAMFRGTSPRAVADGARGLAARPDSLDLLPSITVPTLVIVGEHDQLTPPSDSEQMVQRLPNAKLVTIDQAGHMSNLENPDAVNAALVEFVHSQATSTV
jgi:pimeloyl-ACP methyl ester carboxylesterase